MHTHELIDPVTRSDERVWFFSKNWESAQRRGAT